MPIVKNIQIVGHVCHDKVESGYILGGTASYSAMFAKRLCHSVDLLTSYGPDFLFAQDFLEKNISVTVTSSDQSTIFENIYSDNGRTQYLHSKASDITLDNRTIIESSDILLLCPITNEIIIDDVAISNYKGLKAATIQGWLRGFDENGLVRAAYPDMSVFSNLNIVIMSDDDIESFSNNLIEMIKNLVQTVVITKGEAGVEIYQSGQVNTFPSYATEPVDLTGAGDIFSIAFLYQFATHQDIESASSFAHSAASLSIEGIGVTAIPVIDDIMERQELYYKRYL